MATTEITKILFRRGTEADRRTLEAQGGLAQGEPGFTSVEGYDSTFGGTKDWILNGGSGSNRLNANAAYLQPTDVIDWSSDGGGDFFMGSAGTRDVYIGGASAEKHWQHYFVSLRGTKCNQNWDSTSSSSPETDLDYGYVDGEFQVGKAGENAATVTAGNDHGDNWHVRFYGFNEWTGGATEEIDVDGGPSATVNRGVKQKMVHWDPNTGIFNIASESAIIVPRGTTAARPANGLTGMIRYNTSQFTFEGCIDGTGNNGVGIWGSLGGSMSIDRRTFITVEQPVSNTSACGAMPGAANEITFTTNCAEAGSFEYQSATTPPEFHTTGATRIAGLATVGGTLSATGATTLGSTLGVTGATTLSSTLGVTGVTTISNTTAGTAAGGALHVSAGGARIALDLSVGQDIIAFHTSDQRQKDGIKPIDSALDKLNKIRGVSFTWNDKAPTWTNDLKNKQDVGVIAQEIEAVLPEAVTTREDGYKAVDYQRIVPLLIESIKELTSRVESLENK